MEESKVLERFMCLEKSHFKCTSKKWTGFIFRNGDMPILKMLG